MAVNNSLAANAKTNQKLGMTAFLNSEKVLMNIEQAIGKVNKQRFITSVISAVNNNSTLAECTNGSILSAALLGESLNLSPSPQLGQFYMVPYNDKEKGKVAQFQLGYKGYVQLAIRSGYYKKLNVLAIKAGELVHFDPLNEEIEVNLIDDEDKREEAETIGYYAMFEYENGFRKAIYWSRKKMEKHAKTYSSAYRKDLEKGWNNSFWTKDFDGMAYKTMLRQLISKWGIMSIDMQTAYNNDMAVLSEDGSKDYVDNKPEQKEETVVEEVVQEQPDEIPAEMDPEPINENDAASALFGGN